MTPGQTGGGADSQGWVKFEPMRPRSLASLSPEIGQTRSRRLKSPLSRTHHYIRVARDQNGDERLKGVREVVADPVEVVDPSFWC